MKRVLFSCGMLFSVSMGAFAQERLPATLGADKVDTLTYNRQLAEFNQYVYGSGIKDSATVAMMTKGFMVMHPDYYVNLVKFAEMVTTQKVDHAEKRFDSFSSELQQSQLGKQVATLIETKQLLQPGQIAPDIVAQTADGKAFHLSDLKGKYVLVDFWASWCGPCRRESPTLVQAYEHYKNKNFEIVSFSLDQNADAWKAAITQDHYTWTQVSDLKEFQSAAVKAYSVVYVPKSFLLDPDGRIVATDLRGEMLEKQLEQIYK